MSGVLLRLGLVAAIYLAELFAFFPGPASGPAGPGSGMEGFVIAIFLVPLPIVLILYAVAEAAMRQSTGTRYVWPLAILFGLIALPACILVAKMIFPSFLD